MSVHCQILKSSTGLFAITGSTFCNNSLSLSKQMLAFKICMSFSGQPKRKLGCYHRITAFNQNNKYWLQLQGQRICRGNMLCYSFCQQKIVIWNQKMFSMHKQKSTNKIYLTVFVCLGSFTHFFIMNHSMNVNINCHLSRIRKVHPLFFCLFVIHCADEHFEYHKEKLLTNGAFFSSEI